MPPPGGAPTIPLGRSGDTAVLAVLLGTGDEHPALLEPVGLRELNGMVDDTELGWASRAAQLAAFDRDHRFCGRCGGATAPSPVEHARICTGCGATVYPRLSPAVIVLVERGDTCLLARSPRFPPGVYSAVAGFVEPGRRRARGRARAAEEVVAATDLRYRRLAALAVPALADARFHRDGAGRGEGKADGVELETAGWFDAAALPPLPAPARSRGG